MRLIDAHIHLDQYGRDEIKSITSCPDTAALITVSTNLPSCKRNLELARNFPKVKPAFGFHPEQKLPEDKELEELIKWMEAHREEMIAVGEVGLPYYLGKEQTIDKQPYIELLEHFIKLAKKWEKPIALHAVYEDAPAVCALLEKHSVEKAHFHWFKGDGKTIERMISNRFFISVPPEVVYKEKIKKIVQQYPLGLMMGETDGPWPFEGPFAGKMTRPAMMKNSIKAIAHIKNLPEQEVAETIFRNTIYFYGIRDGI